MRAHSASAPVGGADLGSEAPARESGRLRVETRQRVDAPRARSRSERAGAQEAGQQRRRTADDVRAGAGKQARRQQAPERAERGERARASERVNRPGRPERAEAQPADGREGARRKRAGGPRHGRQGASGNQGAGRLREERATTAPEGGAIVAEREAAARKSRYIPSLDGLRTLAVLAVIAYHLDLPYAIGGLLGVTVFFVLSGYLITSLLVAEWERSQTIDLPHFWLRRVRRLFPAIVTAILVTTVLCTLFNHILLTKMEPDILPSLFFFNNWWQIFQDVSYFEAQGSPSPLQPYWSLAIEEQFYLVWPVLLLIAFKLGARRKFLLRAILVLIVVSALDMALLYDPNGDPSRVYYGTDTRAFSLLIGAWLAIAWPSAKLGVSRARNIAGRSLLIMDGIGVVALAGLVLMLVFANGYSPLLYRGGMVLCSVLTAIVIAVIAHPASRLAKVFAFGPFVWIGKRSYGMYLWHFPIILLMIPQTSTTETPWWLMLLAVAVIIFVSALSYTFIEDPIRKGALGRIAKEIRDGAYTLADAVRTHRPQVFSTVAVVAIALGGVIFVPPTYAIDPGALSAPEGQEQEASQPQAEETPPTSYTYTVLLIGDSVSVRAIPYFDETFPGGHIDSAVSRPLYDGVGIYDYYAGEELVGDVVVFSLGTNGPATDEQLDELIASVGSDKSIYFVNTRSPQNWVDTTNAALYNATTRYDNVYLIDWYSYSAGRDDLFEPDGTHLNEQGAQEFVALIRDTIAATTGLPEEPTPEELAEREAAAAEAAGEGDAAASEGEGDGEQPAEGEGA